MSVAVRTELERGPSSGGHVKCWERLAEAAAGFGGLGLAVYVLGDAEAVEHVARACASCHCGRCGEPGDSSEGWVASTPPI